MAVSVEDLAAYHRLHAEESPHISGPRMARSQSSQSSNINAPVAVPMVRYVPSRSVARYRQAWGHLIPYRRTPRNTSQLPLDNVGFFSYIRFSWLTSFLNKAWSPDERITVSDQDSCDINGQRLKHLLRDESVRRGQLNSRMVHTAWQFVKTRSILAAAVHLMGSCLYIVGFIWFVHEFLQTAQQRDQVALDKLHSQTNNSVPQQKNQTSSFLNQKSTPSTESGNEPLHSILALVLVLAICLMLHLWSWSISFRAANRLQAAYLSVLYKQLLRVSVTEPLSVDQITAVMLADSQSVHRAVLGLPGLLATPLIFILLVPALLLRLNYWDLKYYLFTFLFCTLLIILLVLLAKVKNMLLSCASLHRNRRLRSLHEMLSHICFVKMASKEKLFQRNATELQEAESQYTKKAAVCDGFSSLLLSILVLILLSVTWASDPNMVLLLIFLLIPLKELFWNFWNGLGNVMEGAAALHRLKAVLLTDSVVKTPARKPQNRFQAVVTSDASYTVRAVQARSEPHVQLMRRHTFCCRFGSRQTGGGSSQMKEKRTVLQEISFTAPKERLVGVCGSPGSGKTALLLAVLGQLSSDGHESKLLRDGSCVYVSREPWLLDASLRDNILFHETFVPKRYYDVINCCQLNDDIGRLQWGDSTLVGGSVLTLGQRQRVALARALYSSRDIYLLDDPLSAVNTKAAEIIFERAVLKMLKDHTVIMASRHGKFLRHCQEIFVLHEGKIMEQGKHEELSGTDLYPKIIGPQKEQVRVENTVSGREVKMQPEPMSNVSLADSVLLVPDSEEDKDVDESIDLNGRSAQSFRLLLALAGESRVATNLLICIVCRAVCRILLTSFPFLVLIYCRKAHILIIALSICFITAVIITQVINICVFAKFTHEMSVAVHGKWMEALCKSPFTFFNSTPASQILNWFSVQSSELQSQLPARSFVVLEDMVAILLAATVLAYCSLGLLLLPMLLLFLPLGLLFSSTVRGLRQFHHMEQEARLRLSSFVQSSVQGRVTVQAYEKEQIFTTEFHRLCDEFLVFRQLPVATELWLSGWVRILSLAATACILGAVFMSYKILEAEWLMSVLPSMSSQPAGSFPAATVFCTLLLASCISRALVAMMSLSATSIDISDCDSAIRSITPEDNADKFINPTAFENGSIKFSNVKMDIWPDSQPVSTGISFDMQAGKKIGVLESPGGNTTLQLLSALHHLAPPSQGVVCVGGVDTTSVPTEQLRASVALVPAHPVFFSGSLRLNLDPAHKHNWTELREALERAELWEQLHTLHANLDASAELVANHLQPSERRLLLTACATLRSPKVVVLEEPEEEEAGDSDNRGQGEGQMRVQQVVDRLFQHCTVLVLARHLRQVTHCDQVMLLRDGQVVEFDTPNNLLRNSNSMFSQSVQDLLDTEV